MIQDRDTTIKDSSYLPPSQCEEPKPAHPSSEEPSLGIRLLAFYREPILRVCANIVQVLVVLNLHDVSFSLCYLPLQPPETLVILAYEETHTGVHARTETHLWEVFLDLRHIPLQCLGVTFCPRNQPIRREACSG
jgi:hypothetical protein